MVTYSHHAVPLPALGKETVPIIVENLSTVMTYAFSQKALKSWYHSGRFKGMFRAWERAFFELPERKATRAIIELALIFRAIDDTQGLPPNLVEFKPGTLVSNEGTSKPLGFREMLNKIIHAKEIQWNFDDPDEPMMVCHAPQEGIERWLRAEIPVKHIAQACSGLAA